MCRLSLWSQQSKTFLALLLRRISGTYITSSFHINILVWVSAFRMVEKGEYLATWVLVRFEIEACKRQGREHQELLLDCLGRQMGVLCFYCSDSTASLHLCQKLVCVGCLRSGSWAAQRVAARCYISSQAEQRSGNSPPGQAWGHQNTTEGTNQSTSVVLGAAGGSRATVKGRICSCHNVLCQSGAEWEAAVQL